MKHLLLLACLAFPPVISLAQDNPASTATAPGVSRLNGKVVETMSTAGYTYVQVDTGDKKVWAAAVQFDVKVGDQVAFAPGDPMPNYHSKSLNRDFELVYFTGGITVNDSQSGAPAAVPALPPGHPPIGGVTPPGLPPGHPPLLGQKADARQPVVLTGIKRADGGKTIQEIFSAPAKLAGKPVTVRGQVVKYNAEILGKNWLHIQDGSGSAEKKNNDLTITTTAPAKLGDTVRVTGKISQNRDFGGGYKYSVIMEDAQVTVE